MFMESERHKTGMGKNPLKTFFSCEINEKSFPPTKYFLLSIFTFSVDIYCVVEMHKHRKWQQMDALERE
jgi:hypothetical protein